MLVLSTRMEVLVMMMVMMMMFGREGFVALEILVRLHRRLRRRQRLLLHRCRRSVDRYIWWCGECGNAEGLPGDRGGLSCSRGWRERYWRSRSRWV